MGSLMCKAAATPPVIAGHYNLYRHSSEGRDRTTTQEKWAFRVVSLAIGVYFLTGLALLLRSEI